MILKFVKKKVSIIKSHFTYHFYSNSRDLENNWDDINKNQISGMQFSFNCSCLILINVHQKEIFDEYQLMPCQFWCANSRQSIWHDLWDDTPMHYGIASKCKLMSTSICQIDIWNYRTCIPVWSQFGWDMMNILVCAKVKGRPQRHL